MHSVLYAAAVAGQNKNEERSFASGAGVWSSDAVLPRNRMLRLPYRLGRRMQGSVRQGRCDKRLMRWGVHENESQGQT